MTHGIPSVCDPAVTQNNRYELPIAMYTTHTHSDVRVEMFARQQENRTNRVVLNYSLHDGISCSAAMKWQAQSFLELWVSFSVLLDRRRRKTHGQAR